MRTLKQRLLVFFGGLLLTGSCAMEVGDYDASDSVDAGFDEEFNAGKIKAVMLDPGDTDHAELVKTLPIGRSSSSANRRVVMRLRPGEIPDLLRGDTLIAPAEVQVTTACDVGQSGPSCNYSPSVRAQIILTGSPNDTSANGMQSKAISESDTIVCTRGEHHCKIVFTPNESRLSLTGTGYLPCVANNNCYINLVMWAWDPQARSGNADEIIVGENEGDYLAKGDSDTDKGRLMVIRERGIASADRLTRKTSGSGSKSINTNANPELIYSLRLKKSGGLKKGEQFVVDAKVITEVAGRARFSTQMFLTKNRRATDGNGLSNVFPGSIGEHNGINCTPNQSPCTTQKVAVFRVTEDINDAVYVNIIAKSAVPGGGTTNVRVQKGQGFLQSTRFNAELKR